MKSITTIVLTFAATVALTTTLLTGLPAMAHEGHDKTPGAITAPHGGQLKGTSQLYVELVSDSTGFKLYIIDHDLKTISPKDVKIEGLTQLPKEKKTNQLVLNSSESYFESKVDAKGSHRYRTDLKVTYKGKTETVSFNVEPQD